MASSCVPGSGGRRTGSVRKNFLIGFIADLPLRLVYRVHPLGLMDSTYRVPLLDSK